MRYFCHGKEAFLHERLPEEIKTSQIDCEALLVDPHPIEDTRTKARCFFDYHVDPRDEQVIG